MVSHVKYLAKLEKFLEKTINIRMFVVPLPLIGIEFWIAYTLLKVVEI